MLRLIRRSRARPSHAGLFIQAFLDFADGRLRTNVALLAGAALLDGIGILLLIPILSVLVAPGDSSELNRWLAMAGVVQPVHQLTLLLILFILAAIARYGLGYARDVGLARLQGEFADAQRGAVLRAVAGAPWPSVVRLSHAQVQSVIHSEVPRAASATNYFLRSAVLSVLLIVQTGIALFLAPWLTFAVLAIGVLVWLAVGSRQGLARKLGATMIGEQKRVHQDGSVLLGALKTAAAQNSQNWFIAAFEVAQNRLRERQLDFHRMQAADRFGFGVGAALLGAAIVVGGVALGVAPARLIVLVILFARISGPALQLQQSLLQFAHLVPSFSATRELCERLAGELSPAIARTKPPAGPLTLRGVSYRHADGGGISDASLTLAEGELVGFDGPSGSGKTTLIDLIAGLLPLQSGTISVGGAAFDDSLGGVWGDTVSYVPQDGFLFDDTVRRNLVWSGAISDDKVLWKALDDALASDRVRALPHGLDTIVGERGAALSGGERQRISIARALVRRPRLLILDEATNALDIAGEAMLLARLKALEPRPLILLVAHRRETLAHCDRIIRVEGGRIVDCTDE